MSLAVKALFKLLMAQVYAVCLQIIRISIMTKDSNVNNKLGKEINSC